jgi:phage-related holin
VCEVPQPVGNSVNAAHLFGELASTADGENRVLLTLKLMSFPTGLIKAIATSHAQFRKHNIPLAARHLA